MSATTEPTSDAVKALVELEGLASPNALNVEGYAPHNGGIIARVQLNTSSFERVDGGLPVRDLEQLYIEVTAAYPTVPPLVHIDHDRWDNFPHVLQGSRLCLYLDPATQWNPKDGIVGFLHRLWEWFDDAIANRFDAASALYHPVGGVFHRDPDTPMIVVTAPLDIDDDLFHVTRIALAQRSDARVDVLSWRWAAQLGDRFPGVLAVLSSGLPKGGGRYLSDLAIAIRGQDSRSQRKKFLAEALSVSRHLRDDQHLYVLIAVPNRHLHGESRHHLIGWRLPRSVVANAVDLAKHRHKPDDPHPEGEPNIEWAFVDDSRTAVTTRRDTQRPVNWYANKRIELWGCGALGSWIVEQILRAGASHVTLRDIGHVTRGILVRQNYRECDVGKPKVEALAARLESIADGITVTPIAGAAQQALADAIDADLIIDCTVNTAVAVAIQDHQRAGRLTCPVLQLATDNETATLGILTIAAGDRGVTTDQLDEQLHAVANREPRLAPFRTFWDRDHHPPLTPTLGCSVPTFRGSAADAIAVAATAVTVAGAALSRRIPCGYLVAAAHTPFDVPAVTAITLD